MAIPKPSANIPIPRPFCGTKIITVKLAGKITGRLAGSTAVLLIFASVAAAQGPRKPRPVPSTAPPAAENPPAAPAAKKPAPAAAAKPASAAKPKTAPASAASPKQLEELSRALKKKNPAAAYEKLSAFANQNSANVSGTRAALALGYYDYSKTNFGLASKWLVRAQSDPLLREYALYWSAATNIALSKQGDAITQLQSLRSDFPDSVMTEQALESLAGAAIALDQPDTALAALNAYAPTNDKPALLLLRGEARERAGRALEAVADYQSLYLRFPTAEQGRQAGAKLDFLRSTLKSGYIEIPLAQRFAHAGALFAGKLWSEARNEYSQLLPQLSGADKERAELRIMECGVSLGAGVSAIAALQVTDPDVDAERFFALAQYYRSISPDSSMPAAVESAATRAPQSRWAEQALFLAGNYFWVQLDRDRASGYYKRVSDNFSASPDSVPSQWRVAWTAVLKRSPDASNLLTEHIRRFPGSPFTPDALYWLGRLAEEANNSSLARSYYGKLQVRYPQNYFQALAFARLSVLGNGAVEDPDVLAAIPPVPPATPMSDTIPPAAATRQARADALRTIGFDSSAELELRAAYAATGEPRLLLEAAQQAIAAGHFGVGIVAIRQIFSQLESRPFHTVPHEVWMAAYPMPFAGSIQQWSAHAGLDPSLTAGLIRQESAFDPEAHSGANAIGLMQLLPKTARHLASLSKVGYSRARLTDPDYNVRLGTLYLSGLRKDFGSVESALAAYNAGEERVAQWNAGQHYREIAEFVDSIPFTETREYVQIVTRNAEIYRKLYGAQPPNESRETTKRRRR
ncbi:MAG TPA: transglycosylase SLT domain-containing protein [Candidatus Acidoferrales bacterium]|nr:transglycosylase SLT domain-containing protein [Candidatus Acidoferrales bacterium]